MTPATPLLLDVDGVLNPYPGCPPGFEAHDLFPDDDEPIRLAAAHGEWIRELATHFEVAWATSWGEEANRLLCPHFGLPHFPVVAMPPTPFEPREKVTPVDAFVGERPTAWVDDIVTDEARAWAAKRSAPTLLLEVDPALGLTRGHVDDLLRWASAPFGSTPTITWPKFASRWAHAVASEAMREADHDLAERRRNAMNGWRELLTRVAADRMTVHGVELPISPCALATLIGDAFLGAEAEILAGFTEEEGPLRGARKQRPGDRVSGAARP